MIYFEGTQSQLGPLRDSWDDPGESYLISI
ncbi:hypothetical protein M6B38_237780 [Iris pallida]|uniref:Uncharacterized protein n=1 Tax=Iris pallida TaxID=29817 RepID=A0AAX6DMC7_IRIPA|nr:hypothetical protein M6B38_237780 [Iris pallida]